MLRHVEADRHRRRIPFPNLEVDVRHRAEKRELAGIGNRLALRGALIREPQHVLIGARLKARRIRREHEDRPPAAIADEPNPRPHMNRPRQTIAPFGYEDNPVVRRLLHAIDGVLQRVGIIRLAVAHGAEIVPGEINGLRVIGPHGINRLCEGGGTARRSKKTGDGNATQSEPCCSPATKKRLHGPDTTAESAVSKRKRSSEKRTG